MSTEKNNAALALRDLYWAAGFLEGDGSFPKGSNPHVSASQKNPEPLRRLEKAFGGSMHWYSKKGQAAKSSGVWSLHGADAIELMTKLFPLMSPERRHQISTALLQHLSRPVHSAYRTHCPQGHRYDEKNTIFSMGKRSCRTCQNTRKRARREAERRMRIAR